MIHWANRRRAAARGQSNGPAHGWGPLGQLPAYGRTSDSRDDALRRLLGNRIEPRNLGLDWPPTGRTLKGGRRERAGQEE
jgi:hypothetical protein